MRGLKFKAVLAVVLAMQSPAWAAKLTPVDYDPFAKSVYDSAAVLEAAVYASGQWWNDCLKEAADGLSGQAEKADVIAGAAFTLCAAEEQVWVKSYRLGNPQTDIFLAKRVQKDIFREGIVARILVHRAAKAKTQGEPTRSRPVYRPVKG